jgi:hypothetical protein
MYFIVEHQSDRLPSSPNQPNSHSCSANPENRACNMAKLITFTFFTVEYKLKSAKGYARTVRFMAFIKCYGRGLASEEASSLADAPNGDGPSSASRSVMVRTAATNF